MPTQKQPSRSRTGGEARSDVVVDLSMEEFKRRVKELEEQMYQFARDLEFEEAARIRDQIAALKERHFGTGSKAA